jgi:hypothetical protein
MKIELKKINISLAHSEETILFNAELYVNGKNVGFAKNDGRGGCTWYNRHADEDGSNKKAIEKAEAYCKTLPPMKYSFGEISMNLEHFIDNIINDKVNEQEQKKFEKKLKKAMETKIVWGVKGGDSYNAIGFKGNPKLSFIMQTPKGRAAVENLKNKIIREELEKGEEILNTNI